MAFIQVVSDLFSFGVEESATKPTFQIDTLLLV